MQQERNGDSNSHSPLVGGARANPRWGPGTRIPLEEESKQQKADRNRDALDKIVDQHRQAAATETSERELDAYQFRRFDAKLIPKLDRMAAHDFLACSINAFVPL